MITHITSLGRPQDLGAQSKCSMAACIAGFAAGTRIAVPNGTCRVEDLRSGDLVQTLDRGIAPVVWAGGGPVLTDADTPVVSLAPGVLGANHRLWLSGEHLILFRDAAAELLFGESEVLIAAQHLLGLPGVTQDRNPRIIGYYHLLLPHHSLLVADGVASESLHLGKGALDGMSDRLLAGLRAKVAHADITRFACQPAARRILHPHEARILLAMLHDGDAQSRIEILLGLAA